MVMYRRKKRTRTAPKARSRDEKCVTKWCHNRKAEKKVRHRMASGQIKEYVTHLVVCWKCRSKQLKEKHPATYVLNAIRNRARQRKVPFSITLVQFQEWCQQTGYLDRRGREPECATIDRINHDEGYYIWNIDDPAHAENSSNGHTVPGQETKQNQSQSEYPERGADYLPEAAQEPDETEPVGIVDSGAFDQPTIDSNCPF